VGDALSAPGRWTGAGIDAIRGYFFAVSENRRLKSELSDMRQWRDVAIALKNENNRYRSLLGLKTDPPIPMVAARVVTDSRGPFADTRIANTGKEAGVQVGNPVMSEYGLAGRVIGVTTGASRVLMLTDAASRTPVMIDRTNARAILTGDGGPNPRLDYLRGQDPVREGDRILTSGDGGILPRGLPVGAAVKGLDGKWRVVLASDRGPIDFVRILLFQDFTQVINRKEVEELPTPPATPGVPPSNVIVEPPPPAGSAAPAAAGTKPPAATAAAKPADAASPGATKPAAAAKTSAGDAAKSAAAKSPSVAEAAGPKPAVVNPGKAPGAAKAQPKPLAEHAAKSPAEAKSASAAKASAVHAAKASEARTAAKKPAPAEKAEPARPKPANPTPANPTPDVSEEPPI
jgi:rod shape-determining protein MreC